MSRMNDVGETVRAPALPAHTRSVLFSPVPSADKPSAVVRRLRTAIGLGLLADGEKLPRETDLARQLGVTPFTLREALGQLRESGLVVTRAGRNGGSFVTHPGQGWSLAREELLSLNSTDLRDLGDWRQMLASQSAGLAADRASEADCFRLRALAQEVTDARTTEQARRAHGRFHLELAAAAQSIRLSRAELAVHEEVDWLMALVLDDQQRRRASADDLAAVAEAVSGRRPDDAARAAARATRRSIRALAQLRLEGLAARYSHQVPQLSSSLAGQLGGLIATLQEDLERLAATAAPVLASAADAQSARAQATVPVVTALNDAPAVVSGIGVVAEVGVVPDRPYWMSWWARSSAGRLEDLRHVLDPGQEDFYDYAPREFITHPREHREAWASGPYVDWGGVDDYTVTLSTPIVVDGRFLGVAAADLLVADLERLLAPWLAQNDQQQVVLNGSGRVVISNSVEHSAGDGFTHLLGGSLQELGTFGWKVLTGPRDLALGARH